MDEEGSTHFDEIAPPRISDFAASLAVKFLTKPTSLLKLFLVGYEQLAVQDEFGFYAGDGSATDLVECQKTGPRI